MADLSKPYLTENYLMKFLFLFIDGVGLGPGDPETNPFARADMPNLLALLEGRRLVLESLGGNEKPLVTEFTTLVSIDCLMGVKGLPQSASGQATILTGRNVPEIIGYHYGPKPNQDIKNLLTENTIFKTLHSRGFEAALLNAYPQSYFERINSGRNLPGTIALAVQLAGIPLKTTADIKIGNALSADFTGKGWSNYLNIPGVPILSLASSGKKLAILSRDLDFTFFEYWLSDYAGHRADMDQACNLLTEFDAVLGGLVEIWKGSPGLIFITSDHGNLEDITTRRHTLNPVPGLVIGPGELRHSFIKNIHTLVDITPSILRLYDQDDF
jgi:hypothetical protein